VEDQNQLVSKTEKQNILARNSVYPKKPCHSLLDSYAV
jgi:hypothetical protein